jgi:hypothetical protein
MWGKSGSGVGGEDGTLHYPPGGALHRAPHAAPVSLSGTQERFRRRGVGN